MQDTIEVRGAREHNLKNIDIDIPKQQITVMTGVSGSGKSSLAFDTILSESQRRFFSTLTHYDRQFVDTPQRPQVRRLTGLSPAIQLAQQETRPSPRATLSHDSDLGELFGSLFAKYGTTFCPQHKQPTSPQSVQSIIENLLQTCDEQYCLFAFPVAKQKTGKLTHEFEKYEHLGHCILDSQVQPLPLDKPLSGPKKHSLDMVVDTIKVNAKNLKRIQQAFEMIFQYKDIAHVYVTNRQWDLGDLHIYSQVAGCPECGFSFPKLDSRFFSKNSLGKCSSCQGDAIDCETCDQTGLDESCRFVEIEGFHWPQLLKIDIRALHHIVQKWSSDQIGFQTLQAEILKNTTRFLSEGLGHLELYRPITTLSGGELQKLRLSHLLHKNLRGLLYILDEPSQGLHPLEISSLIQSLRQLCELGNTVLIVDHDEDVMKQADLIIDLGPTGGEKGGHLLACFPPEDATQYIQISHTARTLTEHNKAPSLFGRSSTDFFSLKKIRKHHLDVAHIDFAIGGLNILCGVSGSGKSTLMQCLHEALIGEPIHSSPLTHDFQHTEWIDRQPLGRSSTSSPGSWLGAYPLIRELFASLPDAKIYGLASRDYSLVAKDGARCPGCQGRGYETVSMKFLSDSHILCQLCEGDRFTSPARDITWNGVTIPEILRSSLEEVCEIFRNQPRILRKLQPAVDLGIGYLRFGQPSHTLSGGEAQRLKIAPALMSSVKNRVLLMDEPTQGLHPQDIQYLLKNFETLTSQGVTIIMIEHDLRLIQQATHLLELGHGAGQDGGQLIFQGSVQELLGIDTPTSQALKQRLNSMPC